MFGGLPRPSVVRWAPTQPRRSLLRAESGEPVLLVYCTGCATLFVGLRSMIDLAMYCYPLIVVLLIAPLTGVRAVSVSHGFRNRLVQVRGR